MKPVTKKRAIPISTDEMETTSNYVLVSVSDPTDFTDIYKTELSSHTKHYLNTELAKENLKGKWRALIGAEEKNKRSRFYKNYERLMKQSSSGIEQVLEQIAETGQTSDSVYASAINEQELKEEFENAVYTEDPYTPEQKLAMHEAINGDGAIKRGLSFWRKFLLGKEILVDFIARKQLDDEMQSDTVADRMAHHPDIIKYRNKLREIDDEVKLREAIQAGCDNLFGFGRVAFVKLENDSGYPVRLVPLSSYKLGKVWIDSKTFEFIGVEYTEIKSNDNKNILLASDIVYLTLNDNNVTPNTRYYGNSLIFPILSISETNRVNRERNFPEIIRKKWSATLVIKTNTKNPAKNQAIVDMVNNRAGGTVAIPDLVSAENIKTDTELTGLIQYAIETDKKIFRDMELPMIASGLEDSATTRTGAQSEIHVWSESTLEDLRENITDMLREQWYYPNLRKIIEEDVVANGTDTNFVIGTQTLTLEEPQLQKQEELPQQEQEQEVIENQTITPEENLTLLEKLGFDSNSLQELSDKVKRVDKDSLRNMVIEKLIHIYIDIYQEIIEITQEDVISLSDEIKFPWKVFLKFKNIIFDNFLDRAAGVVGLFNSGLVDNDVSLELLKLEQYKRKMQEAKRREEQSKMKEMESEMAKLRGEALAARNAANNNGNGNNITENVNNTRNQQDGEVEDETVNQPSNPTDIGSTMNRKLGARLNRGRVGD